MVAAYMGLTGMDSLCWFALDTPGWDLDLRRTFWPVVPGPSGYAIAKWTGAIPEQVRHVPGQRPHAPPQLHQAGRDSRRYEVRSLEDLWQRKPPIIAEEASFDPNRDTQDLRGATGANVSSVSRLAFLVGPVTVSYGGDPAQTKVMDLAPYIDGKAQVVQRRYRRDGTALRRRPLHAESTEGPGRVRLPEERRRQLRAARRKPSSPATTTPPSRSSPWTTSR